MMRKGFLSMLLVFLVVGFILKPVTAVNASTNPPLPDRIEEKEIVDFELVVTDINGNCILIETDLEKDGTQKIFDDANLGGYEITYGQDGKSLKVCGNLPSKLVIPMHGRIPEGIDRKTIMLPTGENLYLKFFDLGQKSYYRVKDMQDSTVIDTTSKSFTIIHSQLEDVLNTINSNITDPDAKKVAEEYINLGLIDYVQRDLIPLFTKYDPDRVSYLEQKVSELESLVKKLNSTVISQESKISELEAENSKLKSQISSLNSEISSLKNKNSELENQVSELSEERDSYKGSAKTFQTVSIVLVVLLLAGSFLAYRTGHKSGYKEGYRKGHSEGEKKGYSRGKRDGYEECIRERENLSEGVL